VGEFAGARSSRASIPRSRGSAKSDFTAQSPLHLLAETGLVERCWFSAAGRLGMQAGGVTGGQTVVSWWIIAAFGIEMIHSLTEFPLWNRTSSA